MAGDFQDYAPNLAELLSRAKNEPSLVPDLLLQFALRADYESDSFPEMLAELLLVSGISPAELARNSDLSESAIYKYQSGKTGLPTRRSWAKLSKGLARFGEMRLVERSEQKIESAKRTAIETKTEHRPSRKITGDASPEGSDWRTKSIAVPYHEIQKENGDLELLFANVKKHPHLVKNWESLISEAAIPNALSNSATEEFVSGFEKEIEGVMKEQVKIRATEQIAAAKRRIRLAQLYKESNLKLYVSLVWTQREVEEEVIEIKSEKGKNKNYYVTNPAGLGAVSAPTIPTYPPGTTVTLTNPEAIGADALTKTENLFSSQLASANPNITAGYPYVGNTPLFADSLLRRRKIKKTSFKLLTMLSTERPDPIRFEFEENLKKKITFERLERTISTLLGREVGHVA